MARLRLDDLTKIYGPRRGGLVAVDRLNLDLGDGEVMALLGSSGCGKTSTLRMIAGFEEVTDGSIRLGERAIHTLAPAEREVAMAFEGYSLYPPLTVRDNIAFALLRDRVPKAEVAQKVGAIADLLEIGEVLERHPITIASGQQQRASLARALVRRADLYLLDEPMSQLEPRLRAVLRARIKDWLNSRAHDDGVRDARPDRGDRPCRPHRRDGEGRIAAIRHAPRSQGAAGEPVRRRLHRRAGDEPDAGANGALRRGPGRRRRGRRGPP